MAIIIDLEEEKMIRACIKAGEILDLADIPCPECGVILPLLGKVKDTFVLCRNCNTRIRNIPDFGVWIQ